MIRKTLTLGAVCIGLLALSTLPSQAAFTIADWNSTPTQTVGDTTWHLDSTDLPAGMGVNFLNQAALRVQDTSGTLLGPVTYTLNYTVSLSPGSFVAVGADTTTVFGSSTLTKIINGGLTVSSVDGNPSAVTAIPGSPSTLTVQEVLTIGANGVVTDFSNTYTTVVPEPSTIFAGAFLLLGFGLNLIRNYRNSKSV